MPRGDISKYTDKKRHKAEYLAALNEQRRAAETNGANGGSASADRKQDGVRNGKAAAPNGKHTDDSSSVGVRTETLK